MNRAVVILDTMLLVLLVVGTASREYIGLHRRLRAFTVSDFDLLREKFLAHVSSILVTPNTLTETSNLACQISEPARSRISVVLRELTKKCDEHYRESRDASDRAEFLRLGLTDSVLLDVAARGILLTTELDLYVAAIKSGYRAINFNHHRQNLF